MSGTSHFTNDQLKISSLFNVSQLKCVVTGGGTGIGLMCTQALAANGATVYITGRRKEVLDKAASEYSGPGKIVAIEADVSKKEECLRLAKEIGDKESNGIHLLVNNAGIARDDDTKLSNNEPSDWEDAEALQKHMLDSDPAQWSNTFDTNVIAPFFVAAAFVPLLAKANKAGYEPFKGLKYTSSIVNISSISGLMKGSSSGELSNSLDENVLTACRTIRVCKFEGCFQATSIPSGHAPERNRHQSQSDCSGSISF